MKKHYSDHVAHCLKYYARYPRPGDEDSEINKRKWEAVNVSLLDFTETEREIILSIYRKYDTLPDNVYEESMTRHIDQNQIWRLVERVEKRIAQERGLV